MHQSPEVDALVKTASAMVESGEVTVERLLDMAAGEGQKLVREVQRCQSKNTVT